MTKFILVRHGETEWNKIHRVQGQTDVPLNETGREQARLVGERLATLDGIDAVYASDLQRAYHTAEAIVAHHPDWTIIQDPRLQEMGFGDWEGLFWRKLHAEEQDLVQAWQNDPSSFNPPNGETLAEMGARIQGFVDDAVAEHPEGDVLVVCHGGVIRVLIALLLGIPAKNHWRISTGNTSISVIYSFPEGPYLEKVNDTAHLGEAGTAV